MKHLLDNVAWYTLVGPHARYSAGTDDARRYASGYSPIVGFEDTERPNLDVLARFCTPGEHLYSARKRSGSGRSTPRRHSSLPC